MTPSLLVSIRKRIDLDVFESLTDELIRKGLKLKTGVKAEEAVTEGRDDDNYPHPGNKGKLQMLRSVMRISSIPPTWTC